MTWPGSKQVILESHSLNPDETVVPRIIVSSLETARDSPEGLQSSFACEVTAHFHVNTSTLLPIASRYAKKHALQPQIAHNSGRRRSPEAAETNSSASLTGSDSPLTTTKHAAPREDHPATRDGPQTTTTHSPPLAKRAPSTFPFQNRPTASPVMLSDHRSPPAHSHALQFPRCTARDVLHRAVPTRGATFSARRRSNAVWKGAAVRWSSARRPE